MNKKEVLSKALEARKNEVFEYQINIDNFERAINKIEREHNQNPSILEFKERLIELLENNRTEQLKAKIIKEVIEEQLAEES